MATIFDLSAFILATYQGRFVGSPVSICSAPNHQSKVISTTFDWSKYPTQAVTININSVGTTNQLDKLVGLWIDNSNNSGPVIIYVPDSGQIFSVPELTTQFMPIFSTANIVNVYNDDQVPEGITNLIFCNFLVDNYSTVSLNTAVSLAISSSVAGAVSFLPLAVGDQALTTSISMVTAGGFTAFLPAQSTGFYIITNLQVTILRAYNALTVVNSFVAIYDNNAASVVKGFPYSIGTNLDWYDGKIIYSHDDLYLKLDATHSYFFLNQSANDTGTATFDVGYLYTVGF